MLWYCWNTLTIWMIFNPILHCNPSMENIRQDNWDWSYCIEGHLAASALLKAGEKKEQTVKKKPQTKKQTIVLPKGNSGRSIKPCFPQSGVWKASGWDIRWAFSLAACKPSFISFTVSREVSGSKWQLTPTIEAPRKKKITSSHISPGSGRWRFLATPLQKQSIPSLHQHY